MFQIPATMGMVVKLRATPTIHDITRGIVLELDDITPPNPAPDQRSRACRYLTERGDAVTRGAHGASHFLICGLTPVPYEGGVCTHDAPVFRPYFLAPQAPHFPALHAPHFALHAPHFAFVLDAPAFHAADAFFGVHFAAQVAAMALLPRAAAVITAVASDLVKRVESLFIG